MQLQGTARRQDAEADRDERDHGPGPMLRTALFVLLVVVALALVACLVAPVVAVYQAMGS
jgi:hypothetical protein